MNVAPRPSLELPAFLGCLCVLLLGLIDAYVDRQPVTRASMTPAAAARVLLWVNRDGHMLLRCEDGRDIDLSERGTP